MTERNDTPTGTSAADHLTDAELEAIARGQGLPDRETLDRRLHDLQADVWNAQAVVKSVEWAIRETLDADSDPAHSLMRALRPAIEVLERVGSGLDGAILLAPAEAQEVANG